MSPRHGTRNSGPQQPLLNKDNTPPPPYSAVIHTDHQGRTTGVSYVPHSTIHVQPTFIVVKERSRCRFTRFLLFTIFLFFIFFGIGNCMNLFTSPHWSTGPGHQNSDYPIPRNVELVTCQEPLKGQRQNEVTLHSPVTSDTLLLLVDGPSLGGSVIIKTTSRDIDAVRFSVNLQSTHGYDANTIVCSIKRGDGEYGVGVFNAHVERRYPHDTVQYNIIVELPENHPLINRFESAIVNGQYYLDELEDKILFDQFQLRTSNGRIHAKSLNTHWAELTTTNGPISGKINATNHLVVHTSNNPIDVIIDFNHDSNRPAVLSLTTSNGKITSDISLHNFTPATYMASGIFLVTTKTSNAPINLNFSEAPIESELHLETTTTNGRVELGLHPTYQGHILASSSLFGATVIVREDVEDPSGKGRRRHAEISYIRGRVEGDVSWDDEIKGRGRVHVESSNAKVTVVV